MTKPPSLTGKSKTALTLPAFQRKWEHSWSNQGEDLLRVVTIHKPKITGPPNSQETWRTESGREKKCICFMDKKTSEMQTGLCVLSEQTIALKVNPQGPSITRYLPQTLLFKYLSFPSFFFASIAQKTEIGQILAWPWKSVSHSWSLSLLMCKMWRINGTSQVALLSTGGCTWHDTTCVGNTQNKFLFFYSEKQLLSSGSSSSVVLWSCICCLNWLNLHHHP